MKFLHPLGALGALVLLTACASSGIHYDFDGRAGFAQYKTFNWAPGSGVPTENAIMDGRLRRVVEAQLVAKGFRLATAGEPDFLVATGTVYEATPGRHTYIGFGLLGLMGVGARVGGHHGVSGAIVMEVQEVKTRAIVWKCRKDDVLEDDEQPEDAEVDVAKAVASMLKTFPPTLKAAI